MFLSDNVEYIYSLGRRDVEIMLFKDYLSIFRPKNNIIFFNILIIYRIIMLPLHEISHNMNNVGFNIRKSREKRGFSQEYVAERLGINQSTYGKLERDVSNITLDRLFKIADVLEEDITTLLDIGKKNIFNNQTNQGNGYVETINNDYRTIVEELKLAYEKMLALKDEQIDFLKSLL